MARTLPEQPRETKVPNPASSVFSLKSKCARHVLDRNLLVASGVPAGHTPRSFSGFPKDASSFHSHLRCIAEQHELLLTQVDGLRNANAELRRKLLAQKEGDPGAEPEPMPVASIPSERASSSGEDPARTSSTEAASAPEVKAFYPSRSSSRHVKVPDAERTAEHSNGQKAPEIERTVIVERTSQKKAPEIERTVIVERSSQKKVNLAVDDCLVSDAFSDWQEEREFQLKGVWGNEHSIQDKKSLKRGVNLYQSHSYLTDSLEDAAEIQKGFLRHFISFPGSPCRLVWDMLGAMFMLFDLFMIPLRAFHAPETALIRTVNWVILVFFTADIPASLLVGYVEDGVTVMRFRKILVQYARTWLLIDLVIVVPDWVLSVLSLFSEVGEEGNATELLRLLRAIRVMRLVRVLKLKPMAEKLDDIINSEYVSIVCYIAKMILLLLVINHIIACFWFLLADLQHGKNETWVTYHGLVYEEWLYQYTTAFHWSIAQFTPASMHVQPQNVAERIFTVVVVVLALVVFSYIVGSITGALSQIRNLREEKYKEFWKVRRYLQQNSVPVTLTVRIKRYLDHAWKQHRERVSASGIKLFQFLSEQLHDELKCAIFAPYLSCHPLLRFLCYECEITMQRLTRSAMSEKHFAKNDAIFFEGEVATHAYFPISGQLCYMSKSSGADLRVKVTVGEAWVSEPVLWVSQWCHVGSLAATTECHLILVSGESFSDVMGKGNRVVLQRVCSYAQEFLLWLRKNVNEPLAGEIVSIDEDIIRDFSRPSRLRGDEGPLIQELRRSTGRGPSCRAGTPSDALQPVRALARQVQQRIRWGTW